ncbi:MAG: GNAT family N-acetyltransferase [Saprospiraceae bacterium]
MFHFRLADESDISDVSEMIARLFEEVGHTPDAEDIASVYTEIEEDDRHSTLLAYDDDEDLVGLITLTETLSLYACGLIGVINELYVVPEYRSEGLGKILLDKCKELGEEKGWKRLEVTTPGDEYEKTLRFYEREGFYKIGPRYKCEL